jgi:hypothetical protein
MCKAQEALAFCFVTANERVPLFPGDGYWQSVRDNAALALASDDCVPREVAEQARSALLNTLAGLIALGNAVGGTPPPGYHRRVAEAKAALTALDKALKR